MEAILAEVSSRDRDTSLEVLLTRPGRVRYKLSMHAARLVMCCCSQARVLPGARDRAVEARTD
jgi:hypothetical protein